MLKPLFNKKQYDTVAFSCDPRRVLVKIFEPKPQLLIGNQYICTYINLDRVGLY